MTLVVIRLLAPGDYGLMAMASVMTAFFAMLAELGLGLAVVQAQNIERARLRQVFGAVLLINSGIFLVLQLCAPLLAAFYEEARLINVIRVLAIQFLLLATITIPSAMLQREMQFKKLAMTEMAASVCGNACVLIAAWQGLAVWSLVIGALTESSLKAIALTLLGPVRVLPRFSFTGTRQLFSFGGYVTLSRVLWYVMAQSDVLIAGKTLGTELLGYYSVSIHLASLPMQKVSVIINQVAFPAFARLQDQSELVTRHFVRSAGLLGMVAFPVMWGISSVAPEIVAAALGEHWLPAVLPLSVLPIIIPLRLLSAFLSTTAQSVGHQNVDFRNTVTGALLMPPAFLVGSFWGLQGLLVAWVIAVPLVFALNFQRALPILGVPLRAFLLRALFRPALAAGVMYGSVWGARMLLPAKTLPVIGLVVLCLTGAVAYVVFTFLINREDVNDLRDFLHI